MSVSVLALSQNGRSSVLTCGICCIHGEACYSLDQQRRHQICGGAIDIRLRAFAFLLLSENDPSDVSTRPRMVRLKSAGWLRVVPVHIMFPTSQRFINSHTDSLRTFLKMIRIEWLRVDTDWSVYRYARVGNEFCHLLGYRQSCRTSDSRLKLG